MATVNLKLPDITMEDLEDDVKLQKILSYLYQLNEQLRYELTHIDDDNISAEGVSEEALAGTINRTITNDQGEALNLYASARRMVIELSAKVEKLPTEEDVEKKISEQEEFITTSVEIKPEGVKIKSGGTFVVESELFDIDEYGKMSAKDAQISGRLAVGDNEVWHKGNIVVSSVTPENLTEGMLWVKPDATSIPAAGTWTHEAFGARPWEDPQDIVLSGSDIGAAPDPATHTYTYKVSVPVYHTHNDTEEYSCTVYLGDAIGSTLVNMGKKKFTAGGSHLYEATVTSNVWLGNSKKIYMRVDFSGKMSVNSHTPISCILTAKTTSAPGWKPCVVQMYAG